MKKAYYFTASWCGPCKMLAKNVFTQKSIADKFNSSFVNYKLDAEKEKAFQLPQNIKLMHIQLIYF